MEPEQKQPVGATSKLVVDQGAFYQLIGEFKAIITAFANSSGDSKAQTEACTKAMTLLTNETALQRIFHNHKQVYINVLALIPEMTAKGAL
jgi:hypothetical protein